MRSHPLLQRGDGVPRSPSDSAPGARLGAEAGTPAVAQRAATDSPVALVLYGVLGAALGLVFTQSQVISWFRIYEMFRFESFHMYGVIGSAVATAALSLWALRRWGVTTLSGAPIEVQPKAWGDSRLPGARYWLGGITFGLGWALLGACPGPLVALLGGGVTVMVAALVAALAGTWAYAALRTVLPH